MTHKNISQKSHIKTYVISGALITIALFIVFFNHRSNSSASSYAMEAMDMMGVASEGNYGMATAPRALQKSAMAEDTVFYEESTGVPMTGVDQRVKKNANLSIRVNHVDETTNQIRAIAKAQGGDVMSAEFSTYSNLKRGFITVKIRVENFDKALEEIKNVATIVENESIYTQDVTEQYTDIQSDLKNKKAEERAFLGILDKAETVEEIIKIEQHLSRVRGEIDRLEGRKRLLENQTDFSTITISMTEDTNVVVSNSWRPGQVATDSVNALIKKFQAIINTSIALAITSLPLFLLSVCGLIILYIVAKKVFYIVLVYLERKK